jgi:hypothetical protein
MKHETCYVNYILGFLHCVDIIDIAKVSDVYCASIFRVEVCKIDEFVWEIPLQGKNEMG